MNTTLIWMFLVSFAAVALAVAMPPNEGMTIAVTGDWQVKVGPGHVKLAGRDIKLGTPVTVTIAPPEVVQVRDEEHASLPVYNEQAGPWMRGVHPNALNAQECVATGLLVPGSLKVKAGPGDAEVFEAGKDVKVEEFWTGVGRIEGSRIAEGQKVYLDYDYVPCRLDSIVVDAKGKVSVVEGTPAANLALPPAVPDGSTAIGNVWLQGPTTKLGDVNLYPIDPTAFVAVKPTAETLLPKTLEKLRKGEKVTVVAWGDSVTCGGGVGGATELWYQNRFAAMLRERFPQATIELTTAGWGGQNSVGYMAEKPGGRYDFVREVLDPKPDLVTIEFVNDAGLQGDALKAQYDKIVRQITGVGAEILLITPHFVRPDWMGVQDMRFDDDPRPYVRDLKLFAVDNNIALADASALWGKLWRQGIPYISLEGNWINHPDARGHQMFADALMAVFPMK